jgi:hypothetical protein
MSSWEIVLSRALIFCRFADRISAVSLPSTFFEVHHLSEA